MVDFYGKLVGKYGSFGIGMVPFSGEYVNFQEDRKCSVEISWQRSTCLYSRVDRISE